MKSRLFKSIFPLLLIAFLLGGEAALAAGGEADATPGAVGATGGYDGSGIRIALIDTGVSLKYLEPSHILEGILTRPTLKQKGLHHPLPYRRIRFHRTPAVA